ARSSRCVWMGHRRPSFPNKTAQPIAAIVNNARAALNWLGTRPPDLEEVRPTLGEIVNEGKRAGDVNNWIRALIKKEPPRREAMEINEAVLEVIALTHGEVAK